MIKTPAVSIIIVTWKSKRDIEACLRSIPAAVGDLNSEILVVDNGSDDGTAELVENLSRSMPTILLERSARNLGFARANNLALQMARGEYLLLLNPDTILQPQSIERLIACSRSNHAGVVGAHHHNRDGSTQPSVRRFPTVPAMVLLLLKAHRYISKLPALTNYFAKDFDYSTTQPADQVAGSCMLITRSAFKRIGNLDEHLHIWFEDVDWCQRAHDAGIGVWYCAKSEVFHLGGQSFDQLPTLARQRQFNRSLRYYMKKHRGFFAWLVIAALQPVSLALALMSISGRHRQRSS